MKRYKGALRRTVMGLKVGIMTRFISRPPHPGPQSHFLLVGGWFSVCYVVKVFHSGFISKADRYSF